MINGAFVSFVVSLRIFKSQLPLKLHIIFNLFLLIQDISFFAINQIRKVGFNLLSYGVFFWKARKI